MWKGHLYICTACCDGAVTEQPPLLFFRVPTSVPPLDSQYSNTSLVLVIFTSFFKDMMTSCSWCCLHRLQCWWGSFTASASFWGECWPSASVSLWRKSRERSRHEWPLVYCRVFFVNLFLNEDSSKLSVKYYRGKLLLCQYMPQVMLVVYYC